jgi:hypothetical protein
MPFFRVYGRSLLVEFAANVDGFGDRGERLLSLSHLLRAAERLFRRMAGAGRTGQCSAACGLCTVTRSRSPWPVRLNSGVGVLCQGLSGR